MAVSPPLVVDVARARLRGAMRNRAATIPHEGTRFECLLVQDRARKGLERIGAALITRVHVTDARSGLPGFECEFESFASGNVEQPIDPHDVALVVEAQIPAVVHLCVFSVMGAQARDPLNMGEDDRPESTASCTPGTVSSVSAVAIPVAA